VPPKPKPGPAEPQTPATPVEDATLADAAPLAPPEPEAPAVEPEPEAPVVGLAPPTGDETTGLPPEPEPEPSEPELTAAPLAAPLDPETPAVIVPTPVTGGAAAPTPEIGARFIGEDGEPVTAESFREESPIFTYVVTTQRIYETWVPQGFVTPSTRLVYPRGAHVPRNVAAEFLANL
jgi:hypothetical protein